MDSEIEDYVDRVENAAFIWGFSIGAIFTSVCWITAWALKVLS